MTAREPKDVYREIWEAATWQRVDWMNFHEIAMADPFKAESEAEEFCKRIATMAADAFMGLGYTSHDLGVHPFPCPGCEVER